MASTYISLGDGETGVDQKESIYDVPTNNRKIDGDPEANDDQKDTDNDETEYANMPVRHGTVEPIKKLTLYDRIGNCTGENNTNSTDSYKPAVPARHRMRGLNAETMPSTPSNFSKAYERSPTSLSPPPVYAVPGTIPYPAPNIASGNNQHILIQRIPEFLSVEDIAKHVEIDIIAVENSIDTIKVNRIDKQVAATLKNVKVTEEMLERAASGEKFTLGGDEVDVKPYELPPTDPTKAFISGLGSATTTEDICQYLEGICGSRPVNVLMGEVPGTAMICLQNATDLPRIQKASFIWLSPEEKNWFISGVERSRKISVKAVAMDTTPEVLKNYFENRETSLGGMTESIIFRRNSKDYIVTFTRIEDAENVVRKGNHMIGEVKLEVSSFHPCLYLSEETFTRKPSPIVLYNLDPYMCRFLQHSERYRTDLENIVKRHHGRLIWPPENSDDCLQIEYDVYERDRAAKEKIKDCCQKSAPAVSQVCQMLSVHYMNCALEILEDLKTEFNKMKVLDTDAINIYNRNDLVVIAGETKHVDDMYEKVKKLIDMMEQSLDNKGKQITKMLKLSRHEVELLPATTLTERITNVQITFDKQNMIFKGKKKMVDDALLVVKEELKDFPKQNIEGIGVTARKLLLMSEARRFIEDRIRNAKVRGVLELLQDQTLVLYSISEDELKSATNILQSSLKTVQIKLDLDARNIVQRKEGKRYLADLELQYRGILRTDVYRDELCIVSFDTFYDEINEKITKYIDSQSYITELLPLEQGVFLYLLMYKKQELVDIEQQFKGLCVEVDIIDKKTRKGFMVSGPKDHCKLAIVALNAITNTVVRSDHTVTCPVFDQFLESPECTEEIEKIELSEKCVLTFLTNDHMSPVYERQSSSLASCKIGICDIKIVEGDITDAEVEYIANPADISLKHKRGLGRTLVDRGGFSIQKNCNDVQQNQIVKYGDVFIGDAGRLKLKGIIHMVLPDWNGGCKNEESVLQHAVTKCLSKADDYKASSIAFPPVGVGQFGYPNKDVARILIRSIKEYLVNYGTNTLLRQVYVYDLDGKMSPFFVEMIEKGFGQSVVHTPGKLQRGKTDSTEHKGVTGITIETVTGSLVSQDEFEERKSDYQRPLSRTASAISRHSFLNSRVCVEHGNDYTATIGHVTLRIEHGDLTKSTTSVIVNSVGENLNLNSGKISQAILKAAGMSIQHEAFDNKKTFKEDGFVMTNSGQLLCQKIIHLKAKNTLNGWKRAIHKCLAEVEKVALNSVSFPALGTGGKGFTPGDIARTMIEALKEYVNGNSYKGILKSVAIFVYETEMVDRFVKEIKRLNSEPKRKSRISFLKKRSNENCETRTVVHIYSESPRAAENVVKSLDCLQKRIRGTREKR